MNASSTDHAHSSCVNRENGDVLNHIKEQLIPHIPNSLKIIGNIIIYQKYPHLFQYTFHVWKPSDNELSVIVNPAEYSKWFTQRESIAIFVSDNKNLEDALESQHVAVNGHNAQINWKESFTLSVVPSSYLGTLEDIANRKGGRVEVKTSCYMFYLCKGDSTEKFESLLSWHSNLEQQGKQLPQISIRRISTLNEAKLIADNWKFTVDKLRERINTIIQHFSYNIGIYVTDDCGEEKLVTWVLETPFASQGHLHTLEEYRGLGLAKLAVSEISRLQLEEYGFTYGLIEPDNYVSQKLYTSLGFKQNEELFHWYTYTREN